MVLDELRIRGLGVIEEAALPLGPGLTVVTGETGAGKTILITGLLLLFGGRGDAARVRSGAGQASVDGRLTLTMDSPVVRRAREAGGDVDPVAADGSAADSGRRADDGTADDGTADDGTADDGAATSAATGSDTASATGHSAHVELVLRRIVGANGRSRAFVGGAPAPVSVLSELAEDLLAVHGQADQLRLTRPGAQRDTLDRYAGVDTGAFADAYDEWRRAEAALTDRTTRAAQLRRESELLTHGLAEIEAVDPQPGEDEELTALAARLGHADALTAAARIAHHALVGDLDDVGSQASDVVGLLAAAGRPAMHQAGADPDLDALASRLTDLAAVAADLGADFGAYAEALDADPARLEQVEQRRAQLAALVRKYCDDPEPTLAEVARWAAAASARLAEIDVSDEAIAALRARSRQAEADLTARGAELSARRRAAAAELSSAVTVELSGLAMPDARLTVSVVDRAPTATSPILRVGGRDVGVGPDGCDDIQLLLQSHPAAPAPIGRYASGGELSRIMLALELSLADTRTAATLVFDEVDAGVGGRAATEVGRRLACLARHRQVLVVTHLAQVAAFADRHVVVDKPNLVADSASGVSASDVREVAGDARLAELARMLAGSDTRTAREHAAELLVTAAGTRHPPGKGEATKRAEVAATPSADTFRTAAEDAAVSGPPNDVADRSPGAAASPPKTGRPGRRRAS